MSEELRNAAEAAVAKSALPVAAVTASVSGWGVAEWMYTATIVFIVLQAAYLVWKWRHEMQTRKEAREEFRARMKLPGDEPK